MFRAFAGLGRAQGAATAALGLLIAGGVLLLEPLASSLWEAQNEGVSGWGVSGGVYRAVVWLLQLLLRRSLPPSREGGRCTRLAWTCLLPHPSSLLPSLAAADKPMLLKVLPLLRPCAPAAPATHTEAIQ